MNSITRITPAFDFNAPTYIHVYTDRKVGDTSTFGKMSVKMVDSSLGTREYIDKPLFTGDWGNFNVYDNSIGAYRFQLNNAYNGSLAGPNTTSEVDYITPGVSSNGTLKVVIQFNGEEPVTFDCVYTQNGWQGGVPQGLAISVTECIDGKVRVYAQSEAKLGDNGDFASTDVMQLWNLSSGTQAPSLATIKMLNYIKVWDCGLLNPSTVYNFGVYGKDYTRGDAIAYNITTPECNTPLPCPLLTIDSGTEVNCDTISISGSVTCQAEVDKVRLAFANDTLIMEKDLTVVGTGGTFALEPLNLTLHKGASVYVVMVDELGDFIGEKVFYTIGDMGCVEEDFAATPTVTAMDLCKKRCSYQLTMTGTADFVGEVLVYEAPYEYENPKLVAVGISNGTTWEVKSEEIKPKGKYIAVGVRHDGVDGGSVAIGATQSCEKECVLVGTFKGEAEGIAMGLLNVYAVPFTAGDVPVATTKIVNGRWEVKSDALEEDVEYVLYAIKLKNT